MSDNFWRGQKVLVAGGTGLIGIQLSKFLVEKGARLRIASLDEAARSHPEAEFMRLDLTSLDNCRLACRGQEFVFNLLGVKASPAVAAARPASHSYPTIMMEHALLEAARLEEAGGFLMTSSIAVYAQAEVFHEDSVWSTMPSPNDWFAGWAKRAGELQIEAYRIEYGWKNLSIVRPANVYGPWDNFDSENAMVVPSLIKRALSGRPELVAWGDGRTVRDFIHARDVARGMMMVAENGCEQPVNLGSGRGYCIKELVDGIVANVAPPPTVTWDKSKPGGDHKRVMDVSRAAALGFKPFISLEDGLKEVMDWYQSHRAASGDRYDIFDSK